MHIALVSSASAQATGESPQPDTNASIAKDSTWSLRLPAEDAVIYKGVVSFDTLGTANHAMMYPAPNVAGFLAAVITHGIISESAQTRQRIQMQELADRVLAPYKSVLNNYSHRELMQRAAEKTTMGGEKKLIETTEQMKTEWLIESVPIFFMTQDQRALVLEHSVSVYKRDTQTVPAYRNTIKVISAARDADDVVSFWSDNEGQKLKEESANLIARSLDIAMSAAESGFKTDRSPHQTFRYREGNTDKIERAELISGTCDRLLIRTLRGWLMSIPMEGRSASANHCDENSGTK
jgi:hypothetical protein